MQGLQLLCVIFFALHCGVLAGLDEFLELFEIPYDDFRVEGDGPRSGINNDCASTSGLQSSCETPSVTNMDLLKRQQHSAFGGSCLIIAPGPSINDITDWRFTSNYDVVIGLNNIFDLITNHNIKLSHYVGTGRSIVPRLAPRIKELDCRATKLMSTEYRTYFPCAAAELNYAYYTPKRLKRTIPCSGFCFDITAGLDDLDEDAGLVGFQLASFLGCRLVHTAGVDRMRTLAATASGLMDYYINPYLPEQVASPPRIQTRKRSTGYKNAVKIITGDGRIFKSITKPVPGGYIQQTKPLQTLNYDFYDKEA